MLSKEILQILRVETRDASSLDANALAKNSVAHVLNALNSVDADEACRIASKHVNVKCQRLAILLIRYPYPNDAQKRVMEDHRSEALAAIDKLESEFERCGPSGKVTALGID
ncbi:hypothetical protein [Roseibium sp.]|uniref:hypothetical protein n=1 Tax=Roseibium sp. TaxID=1936156 RepID=UPI003BABA0C4